jgi:L-2-hydroxyglutarate oxidase
MTLGDEVAGPTAGSPAGGDVAIVGGGIVGIALAERLARGGRRVTLLEKEPGLARHQTGHNSGVVHSGIYYVPGSLKARLCRRGAELVREFCLRLGLGYAECGKLIVATGEAELPALRELLERGRANGVPGVGWVDPAALARIEPHVAGIAAVHSPHTAVADFAEIARALAAEAVACGAQLRTSFPVTRIEPRRDRVRVGGPAGELAADRLVICAGLESDRLARLAGDGRDPAIVPFRGEYYLLTGPAAGRVNGLVYPVPDPRLPFLGVHLTKRLDGSVLVGPNAVLAGAREGYGWAKVNRRDLLEMLSYPGLWRLAARNRRAAVREVHGSLSRRAFARQARRFLPWLDAHDLHGGPRGVRAQALRRDGVLVDDFQLSRRGRVLAVRNAPSPGATSAMALAELLAGEL